MKERRYNLFTVSRNAFSNWHTNFIYFKVLFRCGKGSMDLYHSPTVQKFLNQLPVHQILENKAIYQPGCLRKVNLNNLLSYVHI